MTSNSRHLVIQLARFGDLMQTKRLLASLAAEPGTEVHLVVDRSLTDLAALVYPGVAVHGLTAHATGGQVAARAAADNLPVFAELRAIGFDRVYNLNYSGLNVAVAGLFDPELVSGYRLERGQERRGLWQDMAMRAVRLRRAAGLNLVDFWGLFADRPLAPGEVNPVARRGGRGVGVVLAGRHSRRSLGPQTLMRLAAAVRQGTGAERVVLLGSKAERALAKDAMADMPKQLKPITENRVGATDWAGLVDELTGLDALLTPDTGTMHLAAHLGVPVQALFLSSAWCFETGPYGLGHRVWQAADACAPCLESAPCPHEVRCAEAFAGRDLILHLSGNTAFEAPSGLTGFVSAFDALGLTFRPVLGEDPEAAARQGFRHLLGGLFGLSMPGAPDQALAAEFLHEADWMLDRGFVPAADLDILDVPGRDTHDS
ncbi:glycosyltransferase family 9 protein [Desulfocurvus sp. DL9XJH121]